MQNISIFDVQISPLLYVPVVYFLWVVILFVIKKILFIRIKKFTTKTQAQVDDIFLNAMNLPITLLIFVSGIIVLQKISPLNGNAGINKYFLIILKCTTVLALVIFLDRLLRGLINLYSERIDILKNFGGIAQGVVRITILSLGFLIFLDSIGVSITPILASLGIGSLAVALALQSTMENFFSGVQLVIDKPIKVGQFIKLESGEEGYVHKIGWRSSWIRMLDNNTIIIPNKILGSSKIINYYYPDTETVVLVDVGIHYDSDLDYVEKVTIEVAEEVMKFAAGGVPEFKPFIRFHAFNSYSIDFTVIMRCREFVDKFVIKHEFIKRLRKRYALEGIVIPYPTQVTKHI